MRKPDTKAALAIGVSSIGHVGVVILSFLQPDDAIVFTRQLVV